MLLGSISPMRLVLWAAKRQRTNPKNKPQNEVVHSKPPTTTNKQQTKQPKHPSTQTSPSNLFFAICFIVANEIALITGGTRSMSAKWRRSKKHMKWLDINNFQVNPKKRSKIMRLENVKTNRKTHPQKYRIPKKLPKGKWKEPKPLIDMFQDTNSITIVAQIAGFNPETVKITVKNQKLTLSAKAKDRRYYKSLNLPKVVIPNIVHTTCKNGVLEIKLKKAVKEQAIKQQAGINDAT
jgi:HSP20 family molecular chaperone IbpA